MRSVVYAGPESSAHVVRRVLGDHFEVHVAQPTPESLLPLLSTASALLDASMKVPIDAAAIEASPELRLISTATTGASHIDADALARNDIELLTLKGQKEVLRELTPAAEHSWLLLMACARRLRPALRHVDDGGWERTLFPGSMLKGKTIGIIGLGRIGGWMARYALAFGMRVLAYDPFAATVAEGISLVTLEELLTSADFVTLHVNLDEATRGMIDAGRIGSMKPGAVFVNTSRGELTDEQALVDALVSGHLSAVGVDVLIGEPDPHASVLWRHAQDDDRVVITPHIGGFAPEAVDITVEFAARRILERLGDA